MKATDLLDRMIRINKLIKSECTGNPDEFSRKLGISRRQLYVDIECFKDMGVEIGYSRTRRTFYFKNEKLLDIAYSFKVISTNTTKKINGGFYKKSYNVLFLCTE
jgi:predicted DNA-binding transcriptional regulator YafY